MEKILIVSNNLFYGGGESFIINTLSNIEFEVYYIVRNNELYKQLPPNRAHYMKNSSLKLQIQEVKVYIKKINPFCVIFNGGSTLFMAPFIKGVKKIIYRHTTNKAVANFFKRQIYICILHLCYAFADKIIHVSRYALKEQILFKNKAVFIYHGVSLLPLIETEKHNIIRFLYVGRLDVAKGIDIITAVFNDFPNGLVHLDVVGEGEYKVVTNANITCHGFSSNVSEYYQNNDVFITLPKHEAFGLTILDAMNYGLPIITCDAGATTELVKNNINGIVIKRNYLSLKSAIIQLLDDAELRNQMGENSIKYCREFFTKEKTIQKIMKVLHS